MCLLLLLLLLLWPRITGVGSVGDIDVNWGEGMRLGGDVW